MLRDCTGSANLCISPESMRQKPSFADVSRSSPTAQTSTHVWAIQTCASLPIAFPDDSSSNPLAVAEWGLRGFCEPLNRAGKTENRLQSHLSCPAASMVWELTHHALCIIKTVTFSVNSQNRHTFSPTKFSAFRSPSASASTQHPKTSSLNSGTGGRPAPGVPAVSVEGRRNEPRRKALSHIWICKTSNGKRRAPKICCGEGYSVPRMVDQGSTQTARPGVCLEVSDSKSIDSC